MKISYIDEPLEAKEQEQFEDINNYFGCLYTLIMRLQEVQTQLMQEFCGYLLCEVSVLLYSEQKEPLVNKPSYMMSSSLMMQSQPNSPDDTPCLVHPPPAHFIFHFYAPFFYQVLQLPKCVCCVHQTSNHQVSNIALNYALKILSIIYSSHDSEIPIQSQISKMVVQLIYNIFY